MAAPMSEQYVSQTKYYLDYLCAIWIKPDIHQKRADSAQYFQLLDTRQYKSAQKHACHRHETVSKEHGRY